MGLRDLTLEQFKRFWEIHSLYGESEITFGFWLAGLCPDWDSWDQTKPVDNAREAMQQADDWLGVPQVLL